MNGLHAATWSVSAGVHRLHYDPAWVANPAGRALSLSLPFVPGNFLHRGEVVENYFAHLLPDRAGSRCHRRRAVPAARGNSGVPGGTNFYRTRPKPRAPDPMSGPGRQ